ncbi:protein toll-like [Amphibalanus amphitrite]|uniref:protein toll-like n=1 Tax=Amphibalanus amphitrite TaxID=1232801 RepID=UPI001C91D603|nr:protein toll-like [Amphibalanus amphitrite]
MPPRLATLAPLVAALAALTAVARAAPAEAASLAAGAADTAAAAAAPTPATMLPNCTRFSAENATELEVFCLLDNTDFRLRISHTPTHSRLVVVCEPHDMRRTDYEALYAMNLRLGVTHSVVLHQCPLPDGTLRHFVQQLGVRGVRLVKVVSLGLLNDTMPADFLDGMDLETLHLDGLTRIQLHDDFFASTGSLHNLTITGTNTSLPDGLLRHTPQLRKLHIRNLNAGRLPVTFLHGLHNLTKLLATRNGLSELTREHFRDLGRLRHLDLYKNSLETLPGDVFASLTELEVLRMECNPFRALNETLFAGTPRLKLLRINGRLNVDVDVSSLPAGIFRGLSHLELLMLDRLGLQRLPPGLFRDLTALQNLTLDHNELTEIPDDSFVELKALLNLDLSHNQLRQLSSGLLRGLRSLDTIYLNGNGLTELPNEMFVRTPRLQRLFLQDNNLTELGDLAFSGLDFSLHHLDLSNNSLVLDSHEPAFSTVREVRNLDLHRNRIRMIPSQLRLNLIKLERLDLEHNDLQAIDMSSLNFLSSGTEISVMYNNISRMDVRWLPAGKADPNLIYIGENPLICNCETIGLNVFINRTNVTQPEGQPGPPFLLNTRLLKCAGPAPLANQTFSTVPADELVCPVPEGCPAGCNCTKQPSRSTLITACSSLPAWTPPVKHGYAVSLRVEGAGLRDLGNVSWSEGQVASLYLGHNLISNPTPALLPAGLSELRLNHNNVSRVSKQFLERLDAASNNDTRLWLGGNPFVCDCELLPLHHYLQLHISANSLRIMDAAQMVCVGGERNSVLKLTSEQLCPSRTATIVTICIVAAAVATCLLVMLCIYYRNGEMLKAWLYSHNLCLWFVTEEELDADKKYDAFISYSHLDEHFILEQLVPELECGDPKYTLCLHFRDWLAGEFILDQIQTSVQDSRRVIVVVSKNFIQSDWGRHEFIAAHKQALSDRRNRVIMIVYGDLPDPEDMAPELRLYISTNTYLKWGDAHFWQRLRYALPHKGRRLKRGKGRKTEKLGMLGMVNGTGPPVANGITLPSGNGMHAPALGKLGTDAVHQTADQMV